MKLFIINDKIEESGGKLAKMDVTDKKLHANYKAIVIGFSTGKSLAEINASKRQNMEFKMSAKDCLVEMVKQLLSKAPVAYPAVRYHLPCLNPINMAKKPDLCRANFKKLLSVLSKCEKVDEN